MRRNSAVIAVVDESIEYAKYISGLIDEIFEHPEIRVFHDEKSVMEDSGHYDMAFLDAQMDNKYNLLKNMYDKTGYFVFLSKNSDPLLEVFGYKTIGFLMKQCGETEIRKSLEKLYRRYLSELIHIHCNGGDVSLRVPEIGYACVVDRKLEIHLKNGTVLKASHFAVKNLLALLPQRVFCMVDRAVLVNLAWVEEMRKESVTLVNGRTLFISRRLQSDVYEKWTALLEEHHSQIR